MKSILIWILVGSFLVIVLSKPVLTLKPFSLKFTDGYYALGFLFITFSVVCFQISGEKKGFKKGIETAIEVLEETMEQKKQEMNEIINPETL